MGSGLELVGYQFQSSTPVNFSEQAGLYAIRDRDGSPQYVGLTGKGGLGKSLLQKEEEPLDNHFYSFDFYGIRPVLEDGSLGPLPDQITVTDAMAAML